MSQLKVRLRSILKALVTVELQLCSDLFISFGSTDCIQNKVDRLFCSGFVSNDAVVVQVTDHGEVKESLLSYGILKVTAGMKNTSIYQRQKQY